MIKIEIMEKEITLFEQLEIKHITFFCGDDSAVLKCHFRQNGQEVESKLIVQSSDLNRIVSKLMRQNDCVEYEDLFEIYESNNQPVHFESKSSTMHSMNCLLQDLPFYYPIEQIRA
jgi:hypothetical protein